MTQDGGFKIAPAENTAVDISGSETGFLLHLPFPKRMGFRFRELNVNESTAVLKRHVC